VLLFAWILGRVWVSAGVAGELIEIWGVDEHCHAVCKGIRNRMGNCLKAKMQGDRGADQSTNDDRGGDERGTAKAIDWVRSGAARGEEWEGVDGCLTVECDWCVLAGRWSVHFKIVLIAQH